MSQTVHLGFEIGSGNPVEIPVKHMVVAGQTQEAGKTTTMEALITRGKLPGIAFVTKRGERSFENARRVEPYFRERADWQFVASVLEATMRERMKFERSWIIKASKGATTLAQVRRNVHKLKIDARGLSESVYESLEAYLDIVVPRLERVRFASRLDLRPGINTLDLADRENFPVELQSLVMRSCLEWVYEREEGTIAIIPEAWEFIPQSRNSPVKLAAIELIRKGAALHNFCWFDSQDIGGIDKEVLRQCSVWLLGVQREINEIKRTLDNIPAGIAKPRPGDIATLDRGQFFACWGKHVVKTYVWPVFLSAEAAQLVAKGDLQAPGPVAAPRAIVGKIESEETVTEKEANQLREENFRLKEKIEQLENTLDELRREPTPAARQANGSGPVDAENLYQSILARLLKEPAIVELRTTRPELRVSETREVIELDGKSLRGRVARLVANGFFDEPKTGNSALNELTRLGQGSAKPNVYKECDNLTAMGFLTKEADGYLAVRDMKKNIVRA